MNTAKTVFKFQPPAGRPGGFFVSFLRFNIQKVTVELQPRKGWEEV